MGDDFLCQLPKYGMKHSKKIVCMKKLVGGATVEELQNVCPVVCHSDTEPSITLVAPRQYVMTNLGENKGVIQCPDQSYPLVGPKIGAISASIPCECSLIIDSVRKDEDAFPCVIPYLKAVSWNHTLPAVFTTRYPNVKVAANQPILLPINHDLESVMDVNVDIFDTKAAEEQTKRDLEELENPIWITRQFDESHVFLYCWIACITVLIIYIFIFYKPIVPKYPTIALSALLPTTEASKNLENEKTCTLPVHLEVLLWIYLTWTIIFTIPHLIVFIQRQWDQYTLRKNMAFQLNSISRQQQSNTCGRTNQKIEEIESKIHENKVAEGTSYTRDDITRSCIPLTGNMRLSSMHSGL
ncbi:unnamed protein product [Orchesella dallaii]|uniref:Uncharacterized protein n=1 Tax=Orchesella dallaii TaxID=48710 RepID=A0ABP1PS42_9HEXA